MCGIQWVRLPRFPFAVLRALAHRNDAPLSSLARLALAEEAIPEIAAHLSGARKDKRETARKDKRETARKDKRETARKDK